MTQSRWDKADGPRQREEKVRQIVNACVERRAKGEQVSFTLRYQRHASALEALHAGQEAEVVGLSKTCTERWKAVQGYDAPICEVRSLAPFNWRQSTGSVKDLTLATLAEVAKGPPPPPRPDPAWTGRHAGSCGPP